MNKTKEKKQTYAEELAEKIIKALSDGVVPWRKTWSSYGRAKNYGTGHTYSGINSFVLNFLAPLTLHHEVPYYLTYNQAKQLGGQVRKGEQSIRVYKYNTYKKEDDAKDRTYGYTKIFNVFNISQIDGIDWELPEEMTYPNDPIPEFEDMVKGLGVTIKAGNPCFLPELDEIWTPAIERFASSLHYYKTLSHEMIHYTGAEGRMNREGITSNKATFGSKLYAKEELVAEMGACLLFNEMGICLDDYFENTTAYIGSWIKKLQDDPNMVFYAASKAETAANYIMAAKNAWQYKNRQASNPNMPNSLTFDDGLGNTVTHPVVLFNKRLI